MNRYICTSCSRFSFSAAELKNLPNNRCAEIGCKGLMIPAPEDQKCRVCGCTWEDACPGEWYWFEPDLCSRCAADLMNKALSRFGIEADEAIIAMHEVIGELAADRPGEDEIYLSKTEFMKVFLIDSDDVLYKWAKQGLPRKKTGNTWMYPEKACRRWFAGEES